MFAAEVGLAGAADDRVLSSAARDRRAVVTNNITDFRLLHAEYLKTNTTHCGIVYIPTGKCGLRGDQLGSLITALDGLLNQLAAEDTLRDLEYFL